MNPRHLTASAIAMLSILLASSLASASPLDPARVPDNAKWVIHVDLEALADTALAEQVRQKRSEMAKHVRQWFQDRYGIDPREDLDALTMFSDTYESHTGTMILKADFDREKVKTELEKNPQVKRDSWQDHTLYTVGPTKRGEYSGSDDEQAQTRAHRKSTRPMTIVLLDDKTAVFASSADRAKAAVKLLKGDSGSLKGKDSELLKGMSDDAILYGAAINLSEIKQRDGVFPILRQHERIYLTAGEKDGKSFRDLKLVAQSDDVAEQMKTTLEGLVAFSKVWAADSESLKQLAEDTEISRDGTTVELSARSDTETVLDAIGDVRERVQQRIGAARNR